MVLVGLQDLTGDALLRVVKAVSERHYCGSPDVLLQICSELRRRGFVLTENYLLRYAADCVAEC
jgi:hypothetical protein